MSCQGYLRGFDQTVNLILDECHERVFSQSAPVEQVALGLYIIRGDNVSDDANNHSSHAALRAAQRTQQLHPHAMNAFLSPPPLPPSLPLHSPIVDQRRATSP